MLLLHRSLCVILALLSLSSLASHVKTKTTSSRTTATSSSKVSSSSAKATSLSRTTSSSAAASAPSASGYLPSNVTFANIAGSCKALQALYKGMSPKSITKISNSTGSTTNSTTKKTRSGSFLPLHFSPREQVGQPEKVFSARFRKQITLKTSPLSSALYGDNSLRVAKVVGASWAPNGPCADNPWILKEVETLELYAREGQSLDRLNQLFDSGVIRKGGPFYLVMLRIPGIPLLETRVYKRPDRHDETLSELIPKAKALTLDAMFETYEKSRGLVHMDAHPGNVHFLEQCEEGPCQLKTAALLDWGESDVEKTGLTKKQFVDKYESVLDASWEKWYTANHGGMPT